jgi:riboflavin synthase
MYDKGAVFTFSSSGLDFSTVAIGDSIAVNGVCLTVIEIEKECFAADVSQETLNCSIFGNLVNKNSHWHQIIPIPKKNKPKA